MKERSRRGGTRGTRGGEGRRNEEEEGTGREQRGEKHADKMADTNFQWEELVCFFPVNYKLISIRSEGPYLLLYSLV